MKSLGGLSIAVLFLCSCTKAPEKHEYSVLRRQLTPNKKYFIYTYSRPGIMAFSSDIVETRILTIDEDFSEDAGKKIEGAVYNWVSNDTLAIHVSKFSDIQPKDTAVIKVVDEKYRDLIIRRIYEQPINSSGLAGNYKFGSLKMLNNKIIFEDITEGEYGPDVSKIMAFPLGSVIVYSHKDTIQKIEVSKLVKSMNFTRIDNTRKTLHNQPEIGLIFYEFIPQQKILLKGLKNTGYFKDYNL